ncbi:MAG: ABC transporter permease [Bacteroidaceae bacterium]|nr:ABC transporter permease [Bacteroidaceae bacterium]
MIAVKAWWNTFVAECYLLARKPIYWFCMVLLPMFLIFFFTDLMKKGLPTELPVGIVDLDNSKTSRTLMRNLNAYQATNIVAHYNNVGDARRDIQRGKIYAFFYLPKGTEEDLIASRQPKISFYYNTSVMIAGSLIYKDMRAIATLGQAAKGSATLQAKGLTGKEIKAFLQPITTDTHAIGNPQLNYNMYLCTTLLPACIALFIFIVTAYSLGAEIKFNRSRLLMKRARNNIFMALTGKFLPQTLVWTLVMWTYEYWLYYVNGFTHNCSFLFLMMLGVLLVMASQGVGLFMYGIFPSMRMSMSIGALWAVLSFSVAGFTFPVTAMDTPIQAMSWLFPIRAHYMIYQMNVLNGYPIYYSWPYFTALVAFMMLPTLVVRRLKNILLTYIYIE